MEVKQPIDPEQNGGGGTDNQKSAQPEIKVAEGDASSSRVGDSSPQHPPTYIHGNEGDKQKRKERKWGDGLMIISTIIMAAFTGAATVTAVLTYLDLGNSGKIAESAANAAVDSSKAADSAAKSLERVSQAADKSITLAAQANATSTETAATLKKTADANALAADASLRAIEWYKKTADAMADSVKKSQEHHEMQMRAFLTINQTKLEKSQPPRANQPSQFLVASISIENTGLSPAHKVCSTCKILCAPPDFMGPFDEDQDAPAPPAPITSLSKETEFTSQVVHSGPEMSIGPGEAIQRQAKFAMRTEDWKLWNSSRAIAWVFGNICYTDVFGHEHHTNYRFKQANDLKTGSLILTLDDNGNDSN